VIVPRQVHRNDRGDTLVELLVAIVILGLGAVAILAGFLFSVQASSLSRNQSTSDAYARTLAEAIQNSLDTQGTYTPCAPQNQYLTASIKSVLPTGFTATQSAAKVWTGTGFSSCGGKGGLPDYGVQQVVLTVSSAANPGKTAHQANEQLTVILRRPCNSATAYSSASPCT
jgi:prepilin-type N-terminal cleavage/methylation domain-containing protein